MTAVKRLSKPALFRRLGYQPHPGQLLVHNSTAPRRVLACGSRWGKSTCAAYEAVAALLQPCTESMGWIVAPVLDASDRVFRRVHWTFLQHMKHRIIASNERERMLRVCNLAGGISEARGKTADHPVGLLGEGLDWTIIDEAARLPAHIWEEALAQRLVDKQGWALMLSTPHGCNWFYRAFRLGQRRRDPAYESWSSPSWTNTHLPPDAIEAERARLPKHVFDQEFGAQFTGAHAEPCDVCGGPSPLVSGVVILFDKDELSACPECKQGVDREGKTVVRKGQDGKGHLNLIHCQSVGPDPDFPASVQAIIDRKDEDPETEPVDMDDPGPEVEEEEEDEESSDPVSPAALDRMLQFELNSYWK